MFLTKKGFRKILFMVIGYFAVGSLSIGLGILLNSMGFDGTFLLRLGLLMYPLGVLFGFWGRFAEGKGKLLNLGNQLVRKELRPGAFLKEYEALRNGRDLVVKKPDMEVLLMAAAAYDSLADRANTLATVDEIVAVAGEKKKAYAQLVKVSFLFSFGEIEAAEQLFTEVQKGKLDLMSKGLADAILKSDRAKAMGDYKVVEAYSLDLLARSFPKLDNLGRLITHYHLGEVYEKLQDREKTIFYYQYCANNGGETAMAAAAKEKLQCLQ